MRGIAGKQHPAVAEFFHAPALEGIDRHPFQVEFHVGAEHGLQARNDVFRLFFFFLGRNARTNFVIFFRFDATVSMTAFNFSAGVLFVFIPLFFLLVQVLIRFSITCANYLVL